MFIGIKEMQKRIAYIFILSALVFRNLCFLNSKLNHSPEILDFHLQPAFFFLEMLLVDLINLIIYVKVCFNKNKIKNLPKNHAQKDNKV